MKSPSFLPRVRAVLARAKPVLIFDFLALSIWALFFILIATDVWWWDIYDSIKVWASACTYFLMTILGIGIASYVFSLLRRSAHINALFGLLIASILLLLTGLIISLLIYHAPDGTAWLDKFLSSPIFLFPNGLTIGVLVYATWKSGPFLKSESDLT